MDKYIEEHIELPLIDAFAQLKELSTNAKNSDELIKKIRLIENDVYSLIAKLDEFTLQILENKVNLTDNEQKKIEVILQNNKVIDSIKQYIMLFF